MYLEIETVAKFAGATSDVAVLAKINFKYVPKLNLVLAHAGDDGSESSAMLSKLYSDESTLDTMLEQTTDGRNIDDHLASLREFDSSWRCIVLHPFLLFE